MSTKQKQSKKRKAAKEVSPVAIEFGQNDGYVASTGGGDLILPSKTKKVKKEDVRNLVPEKKENLKKKKRKQEVAQELQRQLSKKKQKTLSSVQKRKEGKQTLESLFKSLQEYQLISPLEGIISTAHRQDKTKKPGLNVEKDSVPQKIRSVASTVVNSKHVRVQQGYFETDSETEDETSRSVDGSIGIKQEMEANHGLISNSDSVEIVSVNSMEIASIKEGDDNETGVAETASVKSSEEDSTIVPTDDVEKKSKKERLNKFFQILSKVKGTNILVMRDSEIQAKRSKLPIYAEEMQIVEAVDENAVVIVCSETGSGKTTQIPQFLYESGYTSNGHLIGVTEPRRVAAMSMADRVGKELNDPSKVSFQIRFEGNRTNETKILFMTDGVLLKELQTDLMLSKYSVIIIDEAHERSMYSDVLIGLLSRICVLRAKKEFPLKLIIMSATLRLMDFTQQRLFPSLTPKVIKVESRQFPVQVHFEKKTPEDFVEAAYKKVCKIHEKLPDGAILVFVSGQNEVKRLQKLLTARYPMKGNVSGHLTKKQGKDKRKLSEFFAEAKKLLDGKQKTVEHLEDDGKADFDELGTADCALVDDDLDEDEIFRANLAPPPPGISSLYCLPLYSLLSSVKQKRVFQPPPEGTRLCVLATNVAETSLTIPNIRYVVDTGKEKRRDYDPITGVSQFNIHWISQASAEQRSGRAGRVQAGHAYRLYSSALFEDFVKFSPPEILNKPVDQLILHLKSMNIVKVANFPFPTSPNTDQLEIAEKRLIKLGALNSDGKKDAKITNLGKTLALFPLSPSFAKILAMSNQHSLMPYAICLVSALSVREPMTHVARIASENTSVETQKRMTGVLKQRQNWCGIGESRRLGDLSILLKALGAADFGEMNPRECEDLGLRYKAVVEIRKMRRQLVNLINTCCNLKKEITLDARLPPPTEEQCRLLRQILTACLPNQIAKRMDEAPGGEKVPQGAYQCQLLEEYVFIDSSSMLYKDQPDFVLYQEIVQFGTKKCLQLVTMVEPEWLSQLAEPYCEFTTPDIEKEPPFFDQNSGKVVQKTPVTFSERKWILTPVNRQLAVDILHYKYFCKFFLAGEVCPKLAVMVPKMLAPPDTMIKPWAKLQKKTDIILNAMISEEILTREKLLEVWEKNEEFLLEEYLEWLPAILHDSIRLNWPPI